MADDFDSCPKSMRFGPCGGPSQAGTCEVDARPCPFITRPTWTVEPPSADPVEMSMPARPLVVVDVRAPAQPVADLRGLWRDTAAALVGCVPLLGEHADNPGRTDDAGALDAAEVI